MSVDQREPAFEHQQGVRIDLGDGSIDLHHNLALDLDQQALNRDPGLIDGDAALSTGELYFRPRLHRLIHPDGNVLADADRARPAPPYGDAFVDAGALGAVLADRDGFVLSHGFGPVDLDGDGLVVIDGLGAIVLHVGGFIVVDRLFPVVAHPMRLVVFHFDVLVFLGVDEELLAALLVFEANLVEVRGSAVQAAARFDAALRLVGRQGVGRHLFGIVDAADHDRVVGIALFEIDHHFLADARNVDHAPLLAGPRRRDPHPARAVAIVLALPIPVKLDFDAPVLIGEDLLAGGADHDRGLRAFHAR